MNIFSLGYELLLQFRQLFNFVVLVDLVLLTNNTNQENAHHCVWYDECHDLGKGPLPCVYNGPPKSLANDDEAAYFLRTTCPYLFPESDGKSPLLTCCSPKQVESLKANLAALEIFFMRCPICFSNLAHFFCAFTCLPDQSRFMGDITTNRSQAGKEFVTSVGVVNVSLETAEGIWDSCDNVYYPQVDKPVVEVLLEDKSLSSGEFLNYFGDDENPFVPFGLNFQLTSNKQKGIDYEAVKCSETTEHFEACRHSDCPETSWTPPPPPLCSVDANNRIVVQTNIKDHYEKQYGALFQVKSIFIRPKNKPNTFPFEDCTTFQIFQLTNLFEVDFLEALDNLVQTIEKIEAVRDGHVISLKDVCHQAAYPVNKNCSILHPLQYFQSSLGEIKKSHQDGDCYKLHFQSCLDVPNMKSDNVFNDLSCLGDFGGPVLPRLVFCAFNTTPDSDHHLINDYESSRVAVITIPIAADVDAEVAVAWQEAFDSFIKSYIAEYEDVLDIVTLL